MNADFYPSMQHAVNGVLAGRNPHDLMFNVQDADEQEAALFIEPIKDPGALLASSLCEFAMGGDAYAYTVTLLVPQEGHVESHIVGLVLAHPGARRYYALYE